MTDGSKVHKPRIYQITVEGTLDEAWSDWFEGLTISQQGHETLLTGPVRDQSALHGILVRIRDLGLPLLSIRRVRENPHEDEAGENR
jgi:hypothetical protein